MNSEDNLTMILYEMPIKELVKLMCHAAGALMDRSNSDSQIMECSKGPDATVWVVAGDLPRKIIRDFFEEASSYFAKPGTAVKTDYKGDHTYIEYEAPEENPEVDPTA